MARLKFPTGKLSTTGFEWYFQCLIQLLMRLKNDKNKIWLKLGIVRKWKCTPGRDYGFFKAFLEKGLKELSVGHKSQPQNSITESICTNISLSSFDEVFFFLNYTTIYCLLNNLPQLLNLRQTKAVTTTAPTSAPIIVVSDTELWSIPADETGFICPVVLGCSEMKQN